MIMKIDSEDKLRREILELCQSMDEHIKLLRDYSLTPGNGWLAKSELSKLHGQTSEMETLLHELALADRK